MECEPRADDVDRRLAEDPDVGERLPPNPRVRVRRIAGSPATDALAMTDGRRITEDGFAEKPAIEWLRETGWMPRRGTSLIPGESQERTILGDVVLQQTFRAAVARVNSQLPAESVVAAVDRAMTTTSPIAILDHQGFHEVLLSGVPSRGWTASEVSSRRGRGSSTGSTRSTTSSRSSTS